MGPDDDDASSSPEPALEPALEPAGSTQEPALEPSLEPAGSTQEPALEPTGSSLHGHQELVSADSVWKTAQLTALGRLLQDQHDEATKRLMERAVELARSEWEQEILRHTASFQHRAPSQLHAGASRKQTLAATCGVSHVYKKKKGRADMEGTMYEVKLAALFYVRAINSKQPFQLATNMAAAGAFDDIVLRRFVDHKWLTTFIQLKHKLTKPFSLAPLLTMKSKCSLFKFGTSYQKMKTEYETEDDLKWCGPFEDIRFVIYTNAVADDVMEVEGVQSATEMLSFLSTSSTGLIHHFDTNSLVVKAIREIVTFKSLLESLDFETDHVDDCIKEKLKNLEVSAHNTELGGKKDKLIANPKRKTVKSTLQEMASFGNLALYTELLSNMHLYTGQANQQQVEDDIVTEIRNAFRVFDDSDVMALYGELYSMIHGWWDAKEEIGLWLTQESTVWQSIVASRVAQLSKQKIEDFAKEKITFVDDSLIKLRKEIRCFQMLNIIVKEGTKTMIGSKIYESLKSEHHIFTGLKELVNRTDEVFSVWRNELCDGLVIDCDEQLAEDEVQKIAREMEKIISENVNLRCVLVSTKRDLLTKSLQKTLKTFTKIEDKCSWCDLTEESRTFLLSRKILFQGHPMVLNDLINGKEHLTHLVNSRFLAQLAQGEHRIGQDLDKLIDCYIPRKLSRGNTSINIGSLTDLTQRTVLVIAEPGMGKTTLITHLAQAAKTADPTTWVVRINLIDCTSYLATLNSDQIKQSTAVKFLTDLSQVRGSDLEESLLLNRINTSGNIIAHFDGVDEVCPFHEDKICSILKHLQETKITKLFVSSRITAKKSLERALAVHAFVLEPFTLLDQNHFFRCYWESVFINDSKALNKFVSKIMSLAKDTFHEDSVVIGIPLQTRMLAEYFDEYLGVYRNTGILQVPEHINLLKLFESFVEKKINIHFEEKKKEDLNNTAVIGDNINLKKLILANHMHAALDVLLSKEELLTVKSPDEMYTSFREQIEKGYEKMGIITAIINNKPQFLHRTFCEYFAAIWISQNYDRCRSFLEKSLFEPRFQVVRSLLDMQLSNTCNLHEAVISCDLPTLKRLLSSGVDVNRKDGGGRTALHLATAYCGRDKQQQQQIVQTLLDRGARVDELGDLLQWSPLRYADKVGAWAVAGLILQAGGHKCDMVETKSNLNSDVYTKLIAYLSDTHSSYVELMLAASRHGDMPVVKFLVEDCHADVNCRGVGGVTPMHVSAECGQLEAVLYHFENHASVEATDDHALMPIHYAAGQGQTVCVKLLLGLGSAVDTRNVDGWTPLMCGARFGNTETLVTLINKGADVNASNTDGWTPLLCSVEQDHEEASNLLIGAEADVNARTSERWSPLLYATRHGNTHLMDCLTQNGARLETNNNIQNNLPIRQMNVELLCAAFQGNVSLITDLIQNGASVNCSNTRGTTPIHWAVMKNYPECVRLLVNAGANIHARDNQGLTALFNVCNMTNGMTPNAEQEQQAKAMLDILVQSGSDITVKSNNGQGMAEFAMKRHFPLIQQCIQDLDESMQTDQESLSEIEITDSELLKAVREDSLDRVKYLLEHGSCQYTARDEDGNTLLHLSSLRGALDIVRYLIDQGADLRVINNEERTIQHLVCQGGSLDVLTYLVVEHKVDLRVRDMYGDTLQHFTCRYGTLDVLRYLAVEHKADLTVTNMYGDTLQHYTSRYGTLDVLKYLVSEHKADLKVITKEGVALQHYTCRYGMLDVLKYLVSEHNADLTVKNNYGTTLLHYAAWKGKLRVAEYLIEKGADPKARKKDGQLPVDWIDYETPDREKMVRLLQPLS